jgi:Predicted membrane protein (DUF2207)
MGSWSRMTHAHRRQVPIFRFLAIAVLLGSASMAVSTRTEGAEAQFGRSVAWDRYDVTLDLRPDGSYHVIERQVVDFEGGPFSTGFADIPMGRIDDITNVVVREETPSGVTTYEGTDCCDDYVVPGEYTWGRNGGYTSIRWGFEPSYDEQRTFLLEYDVIGALRVYAENDPPNEQVWWTAIGKEATDVAPVRQASMTIRLPQPVDFGDVVMSQDDVKVDPASFGDYTKDGRVWTWTKENLNAGGEFLVRLQIPPIVQADEPRWQQADDARRKKAEEADERRAVLDSMFLGMGLLGLVGGGLAVYGLWYVRGRDPHVGEFADFIPQPPDDLPPGAAGALVDEVVDQRDVVATLVDLARRGVVTMSETSSIGLPNDVELTLTEPNAELALFEKEALNAVFAWKLSAGTKVNLWNASATFAQSAPGVRSLLYGELVKRGYFAGSPEETRTNWRNRALRLLIFLPIGGVLAWLIFFRGVGWFWFALGAAVVLILAVYLLSGALPKKTRAGAEAAARWRAFRRYLEGVQQYEKVGEQQQIFDKYLPYAIAFGLEASWVNAFADAGTPAPKWYAPVWRGGLSTTDLDDLARRRHLDPDADWTVTTGRSWWDVTGGDRQREESGGGDGGGGRFHLPSLPDWQGTSDHVGQALSHVSNGLLSMFQTTGNVLGSMIDSAAESDWGSSSGSSHHSSSGGHSSFGGGGSHGGSSGGGRRGFG